MESWKDFSARHAHELAQYLERVAEAERERRIRAVLANQPAKAHFLVDGMDADNAKANT